jgi:hypothetical protein
VSLVRIISAQTGIGLLGFPLRSDFISFWTASLLALQGRPEAAYDMPAHRVAEQALFSDMEGYSAFFYPPVFFLDLPSCGFAALFLVSCSLDHHDRFCVF